MGKEVTMGEALVVTLVSMLVVFLVLILISYIIGLLKSFGADKPKLAEKPTADPVMATKTEISLEKPSEEDHEELIAVIAAAVAANMGLNIPDIRINSIRRVSQQTTAWREIGKQEQLFGKL